MRCFFFLFSFSLLIDCFVLGEGFPDSGACEQEQEKQEQEKQEQEMADVDKDIMKEELECKDCISHERLHLVVLG